MKTKASNYTLVVHKQLDGAKAVLTADSQLLLKKLSVFVQPEDTRGIYNSIPLGSKTSQLKLIHTLTSYS